MSNPNQSSELWAIRLLRLLARWVIAYPRLFFYPQVVLLAVCLFYTVDKLQFNTSRNDLVGKDKKYHQNFLNFRKEFPQQDDLVVLVESEDMEKNRQFVERLGARLETETNLFTDVFYKGDLKLMGPKALLFLEETNLVQLRDTLRLYRPFVEKFSTADNLVSLFRLINRQFRTAKKEANAENQSLIRAIPALDRIVAQAADSARRSGTPPSPGITALFGAGLEAQKEMYITYDDGRMYLLNAHACREDLNMRAVERLRELVAATQAEVPGLNVGVTGEPVLEHDEMAQSQYDTTVATIVSLVIVALIFIYGYQESGRPIKATICLVVGLGYTMGFTTLTVGHLNILTITFLPMLIGLAIDFGVHLISRYEEELRLGSSDHEALEKAMVYTGLGIFTGCFTTAGAFFAMGITRFRGIQEMGVISGGGLLICLIPMMTLLPVLLLRGRQNVLDHRLKIIDRRALLEQAWLSRPKITVGVTLALCLLAATQLPKVYFDYNLLNMQSKGLPAVMVEKKLINSASNSVLFGAIIAESLPHAVALEQQLTNLSSVASVKSMSFYMASEASNRLEMIKEIKQDVASIHLTKGETNLVNLPELNLVLWSFKGYLGLALNEVSKDPNTFLLTPEDFDNPGTVAQLLLKQAKPIHQFVWGQLSAPSQQVLQNTNAPKKLMQSILAEEFNKVLHVPNLDDKERFMGVIFSPSTLAFKQQNTSGTNLVRFNRLLLEDAFPSLITLNLQSQLSQIQNHVMELRNLLMYGDSPAIQTRLTAFQQALLSDIAETFEALKNQDVRSGMQAQDLPAALRNRFVGITGKYLLQVFPKEDVWQRDKQELFVRQLRAIDPNVTGTPVQLLEYTSLLKNSYEEAAWYALGAIVILVLFHFRSLACVVLSLLPVGIGALWMVGIMGFLGIPFNPANIMTLPLVIGIGVTSGIHILNRFSEEQNPGILAKSTGLAVIVSALTTVAGFGSLVLAKHQGIQSLGFVMAVGTATCMVAAITFLPALMTLLIQRGWGVKSIKNPVS